MATIFTLSPPPLHRLSYKSTKYRVRYWCDIDTYWYIYCWYIIELVTFRYDLGPFFMQRCEDIKIVYISNVPQFRSNFFHFPFDQFLSQSKGLLCLISI